MKQKEFSHAKLESIRPEGTVEEMFDIAAALAQRVFAFVSNHNLLPNTMMVIQSEAQVSPYVHSDRSGITVLSPEHGEELREQLDQAIHLHFPAVKSYGIACRNHSSELLHMRIRVDFGREDYFIITQQ